MSFDQKAYLRAYYLAHRAEAVERQREYNRTYQPAYRAKDHPEADERREKHRLVQAEQRRRHPERITARLRLSYAVQRGKIERGPCETCGDTTRVEAHHHKGYDPEHWYDVMWLCSTHHGELHRIDL